MRLRPDFRAAVSLKNRLHRESGEEKLQNQHTHSNTGGGTLPQAIPGGTRPKVGGSHDKNCKEMTSSFLLQLVSFTVDGDPL